MPSYLAGSAEISELRSTGYEHMCWLAADIKQDDWVIEVTASMGDEIDRLAEFLQQNPLPMLQRQAGGIRAARLPAR